MSAVALMAGVLLLLYGAAVLVGEEVASHRPLRRRSRVYAAVSLGLGAGLGLAGLAGVLGLFES
jgi:xanthine/uracil permease